jgi:hypothetical protein
MNGYEMVKVGKRRYVFAWITMSVVSGILIRIADMLVAAATLNVSTLEASAYWFLSPAVGYVIWTFTAVATYSLFSSLKISKVIPWMWGLGGFGAALGILRTIGELDSVGREVPLSYIVTTIAGFIMSVFIFGRYFSSKHPQRM